MISDFDVRLDDHRVVHGYDIDLGNPSGDDRLAVCWHQGTPNIGSPPRPLFEAADRLGLRWFSFTGPATAVPRPCPTGPSPTWPSWRPPWPMPGASTGSP